jgi:hypothetical protein
VDFPKSTILFIRQQSSIQPSRIGRPLPTIFSIFSAVFFSVIPAKAEIQNALPGVNRKGFIS